VGTLSVRNGSSELIIPVPARGEVRNDPRYGCEEGSIDGRVLAIRHGPSELKLEIVFSTWPEVELGQIPIILIHRQTLHETGQLRGHAVVLNIDSVSTDLSTDIERQGQIRAGKGVNFRWFDATLQRWCPLEAGQGRCGVVTATGCSQGQSDQQACQEMHPSSTHNV